MKVGLIDVDGHNFPNIPLMKLSAWHKSKGDHVEFYEPLFGHRSGKKANTHWLCFMRFDDEDTTNNV